MIHWLNANSGFIMALLTLIYVGATIAIVCFNIKATKTGNKQLDEMKEQFYEEFRPILIAEAISWGNRKITFKITNIGNRAAKNISFEYLTQAYKPNGRELVIKGDKKHEVLADNRLLQPQKSVEYILENYNTENSSRIDLVLSYESYKKGFEERMCVHSNETND